MHNLRTSFTVLFHDDFNTEFLLLHEDLQDEILAHASLLARFGPNLGRPFVDTLKGSVYPNMKELRFSWKGEIWRLAFAFDTRRQAVILVGGNKCGVNQRRFYKRLIDIADARFSNHLLSLDDMEKPNAKKA